MADWDTALQLLDPLARSVTSPTRIRFAVADNDQHPGRHYFLGPFLLAFSMMRRADSRAAFRTWGFTHSGHRSAALDTPSQMARPFSLSLFEMCFSILSLLPQVGQSVNFLVEELGNQGFPVNVSEGPRSNSQTYGFCSDPATFFFSPKSGAIRCHGGE